MSFFKNKINSNIKKSLVGFMFRRDCGDLNEQIRPFAVFHGSHINDRLIPKFARLT